MGFSSTEAAPEYLFVQTATAGKCLLPALIKGLLQRNYANEILKY
jgi:hypothetical protein